jgi:predicted Zn-dependent protease
MKFLKTNRFWPGLVLLGLAILLPKQAAMLIGGAVGWMVFALVIWRNRVRMEYQTAIRHLRRGEYQQAIAIMDALINTEPDSSEHHRFRANLYRLAGDWNQAEQDCEWIIKHNPDSADAYMGLAEIVMQQGDYDRAQEYMLAALERDPGNWTITYNLGMIEDRRGDAEAAVKYLETTLASGIRHSHYKLLARLWLARNYHRLGRDTDAEKQLTLMGKQARGLRAWRLIFESEQGAVLRDLLEQDVQLAQELLEGKATLTTYP